MKISTSKTEVRPPILTNVLFKLAVYHLKQVEKFKYFVVTFKSNERQDEELDVRSGKASAVMQALHRSVVLKWELLEKVYVKCLESIGV